MKFSYRIFSGMIILAFVLSPWVGVNASAITPNVTYNFKFTEVGLLSGTNWSVNLNGVVMASTTNSITFTGLSAGNEYYYYEIAPGPSGSQFAPAVGTAYNCCIDPSKQSSQDVVYVTQYSVTFAVSPTSCGSYSCGSTGPIDRSSGFFNKASIIAVSAITNPGVSVFFKWSSNTANIVIGNAALAATNATINGAGTVTAKFNASKYTAAFDEVGLSGQSWTVTFGGATSPPTTSSKISFKSKLPAGYGWSVSTPGAGTPTQHIPMVSGSTMYVPSQVVQQVQFLTQYQVSWATAGGGTIGFCYDLRQTSSCQGAGGPVYFNAKSIVEITAYGTSTTAFSSWTASPSSNVVFGNSGSASTTATIIGPATITANFSPAFPCSSTCIVTFTQAGLPAGQGWYVTWCLYYNQNCQVYTSTTGTINIPNVAGGASGTTYNYYVAGANGGIGGGPGVQYLPIPGCNTCIMYVGEISSSQTTQTFVYTKQDYLTIGGNPSGSGSISLGSGWYNDGTNATLWFSSGYPGYAFSSWSSSSSSVTFLSANSASTQMKIKGPAAITANLAIPTKTVTFQEYGLPTGTIWGLSFNGQWYFSTLATPGKVVIQNVGAFTYGVGWGTSSAGLTSPINGGAGIQYASGAGGSMVVAGQTSQVIIFTKQVKLTLAVAPSSSAGGTNPGPGTYCSSGASSCASTYWIDNATQFAVAATFTSFKFTGWSTSTNKIHLSSTSANATVATLDGTGTITATFA